MKSGTTNVMIYLSLHPRLATSANRFGWPVETRFFSQARDVRVAVGQWRTYLRRYPAAVPGGEARLVFDKSPNYLVNPIVPEILGALAPSLKLLVMLRNPTRRAYSHFQHDCRNGRLFAEDLGRRIVRRSEKKNTNDGGGQSQSLRLRRKEEKKRGRPLAFPCAPRDFDRMILHDVADARRRFNATEATWLCDWTLNGGRGDSGFVPRGLYACHLRRWLDVFPRAQLLPLIFEDFVATRRATLRAVADVEAFLGVPPFDYETSFKVALVERFYAALPSRGSTYDPILETTASYLDALYCQPNRDLRDLLFTSDQSPPPPNIPWPCLGEREKGNTVASVGDRHHSIYHRRL
mmetsp:Transcript_16422/g.53463  ORF Transcript_16422/g.53463 Transcript_16422/m.53463 type:complete len:350 (-) Transcript_16422:80-1129(-)